MSDEKTEDTGQDDTGQDDTGQDDTGQDDQKSPPDPSEGDAKYRDIIESRAKERQRRKELEEKLEKLEKQTAADLAARVAEAEKAGAAAERAKLSGEMARVNIRAAAVAAGFVNPDEATKLIGTDGVDDSAAAEAKVAELAKSSPHLLGRKPFNFDQGAQGDSGAGKDAADMSEIMRRMSGH